MKISSKQLFKFSKEKRKKESHKFIIEDFKKQVYDKKYDLQGGDFLSYPLDLNLFFKKSGTIPLFSFMNFCSPSYDLFIFFLFC